MITLPQKSTFIKILMLALLVLCFRLPSLPEPFDKDSGVRAYGARLIVQGEPLYSRYLPEHNLPATYYLFALAFTLFGDSLFAVKFFLALWTIGTAALLYRLSCHFMSQRASWLAIGLFLLLTSDNVLQGNTAQTELFANLPRVGAILLLLDLTKRDAPAWQYSGLGLLSAFCVLFKANYISPLILTVVLFTFKPHRFQKPVRFWESIFWLFLGFLVGFLPVIAYFSMLGLLPRVLLSLKLGQVYLNTAQANPLVILFYPLLGLSIANPPALVFGLAGAGLMMRQPIRFNYFIPLWLLLSFIEAGISRKPYVHYYLLILPPLSLLIAWLMVQLKQFSGKKSQRLKLIQFGLLLTIGWAYFYHNYIYLSHYVRYQTGQESYRDFVLHRWPSDGEMLVAIQDFADNIQSHSAPNDQIYVWDSGVQLYYVAQRPCALDLAWPDSFNFLIPPPEYGSFADMQKRLLAPTTRFILLGFDNPPNWLRQGLAEHYQVVQVIGQRKLYQRTD